MNIYTVCTPPKYNISHVKRLFNMLSIFYSHPFNLHCYYEKGMNIDCSLNIKFIEIPNKPYRCDAQWNKIDFFNPSFHPSNQPIIIMDLDWTFVRDITNLLDTPIQEDEFWAVERWWKHPNSPQMINGGMYKFYSWTGKKIYECFIERPLFWQSKYINPHRPPPTGEQDFVFELVSLMYNKVCFFDGKQILRYVDTSLLSKSNDKAEWVNINYMYEKRFGQKCVINNQYNSNICMVHGIF